MSAIQYFRIVRTPSMSNPASRAAASVEAATGSITPGLGNTCTTDASPSIGGSAKSSSPHGAVTAISTTPSANNSVAKRSASFRSIFPWIKNERACEIAKRPKPICSI